jgi:hypothetical protein
MDKSHKRRSSALFVTDRTPISGDFRLAGHSTKTLQRVHRPFSKRSR